MSVLYMLINTKMKRLPMLMIKRKRKFCKTEQQKQKNKKKRGGEFLKNVDKIISKLS